MAKRKDEPETTAPPIESAKPPQSGKGGLRKAQIKILTVLAKGKALTRQEIAKQAGINPIMSSKLSSSNPVYGYPSLLTLGYVKQEEDGFSITPAGKKALASIK